MQQSNLIQLLKTFHKKELKGLHKFVRSPYYNQRQDVIDLHDYIVQHLSCKGTALQREQIFQHIFKQDTYHEQKLRHLMSYLMKVVKTYLSIKAFEADKMSKQLYLFQEIGQRDVPSVFQQEAKNTSKMLANETYQNGQFYQQKFRAELEFLKTKTERAAENNDALESAIESLSVSFVAQLLRLACRVLSESNVTSQQYDLPFLSSVLVALEQGQYRDIPVVQLYYYSFLTLKNWDREDYFETLQRLVKKHLYVLPQEEALDLYLILINFCIRKSNKGETFYARAALQFYQQAMDDGTLLEHGFLSHFNYSNIFKLGLKMQQLDWAQQFLEQYKKYLHPTNRESHYQYNMAIFYYWKKEYAEAMNLLRGLHFKGILFNLNVRRMLLRIYYEMGEIEVLDSLLKSFRAYINRHVYLTDYHRALNKNLIKFVAKMLKSNLKEDDVRAKLQAEIEVTVYVAEKHWLLEQLGDI